MPAADAPSTPARGRSAAAVRTRPSRAGEATLCIDVGGSGVKAATCGRDGTLIADSVRVATTYPFPPDKLIAMVVDLAKQSPPATRLAMGFPGMVRGGRVLSAPHFVTKKGPGSPDVPALVGAWQDCPLADRLTTATGLPCRLANDADIQGLAAVQGSGLEFVITLGTGVGTALFLDGELAPHLELAHHPLHNGKTYNEMLGDAARRRAGDKRWSVRVDKAVVVLRALVYYDRLYIGGGNAPRLTKAFQQPATIVPNTDGIVGGEKLWSLTRLP